MRVPSRSVAAAAVACMLTALAAAAPAGADALWSFPVTGGRLHF